HSATSFEVEPSTQSPFHVISRQVRTAEEIALSLIPCSVPSGSTPTHTPTTREQKCNHLGLVAAPPCAADPSSQSIHWLSGPHLQLGIHLCWAFSGSSPPPRHTSNGATDRPFNNSPVVRPRYSSSFT
ncbi:unnamed protein product, partial [Ectocarpus sp. 12 AP-2014]